MPYEFRLPDIGEGVAEGEVVKWFVTEGETVKEDGPLVSVLTDKANVEIPSPKSGKILKLHAKVGEKVKVGGLLVTIDAGGPDPPSPTAVAPSPSDAKSAPTDAKVTDSNTPALVAVGRVLATPGVRRLAAEKGIDLSSIAGSGPNGRITEADLSNPVPRTGPSPEAIASDSVVPPATLTPGPSDSASTAPAPAAPAPAAPAPAAPAPAAPESVATAPRSAAAPPAPPAGEVERIPIRGVRRAIFDHMTEATHRAALFTYVEEVDVSELVRLRDKMAKHVEKEGVKLSYLPFIIKAVVAGLREHPRMNARMDDEHLELVVHRAHDIGIATAAPEGLIVPVVRNAGLKSIAQLAREIHDLAVRGRAGKLQRSELINGTFTITSLGLLGGVLATPIVNYPEVAILGVHKIAKRPVYQSDGSVGPAHLMNLSISLDHRVLDGVVGAQFLAVVKGHLEDPHQLFTELA